jgi:hypothetical protein
MLLLPQAAVATQGDVFARGYAYQAATYTNHRNLFGVASDLWTVDINGVGDDYRTPLYAPEAGTVAINTTGWGSGYGNSIVWTSADGREKLHLAHLDSFGTVGEVAAGDPIGRLGMTGNSSGPHLHITRSYDGKVAPLVLSGHQIVPSYVYNGNRYTSAGPYVKPPASPVYPGHPAFSKTGNPNYWLPSGAGFKGTGLYTPSYGTIRSSFARWTFDLAELGGTGRYTVEAYVPAAHASSRAAHYHVNTAGGLVGVVIDQSAAAGTWVSLGVHDLAEGSAWVELDDVTGEPFETAEIAFDAIRITPAAADAACVTDACGPEALLAAPAAPDPGVIGDQAADVTFDRFVTDRSASYSGGSYVYGRWSGTALEVRFSGTGIRWIGPTQPHYGMADVYLDGAMVATANSYAPAEETSSAAVIWESGAIEAGAHTLRVELNGSRDASSTGDFVVFDHFEVEGASSAAPTRLPETSKAVLLTGGWERPRNGTYTDGSYRYSRWAGTRYQAWFTGTGVAWIGPRTGDYGRAAVYIDGVYQTTVSQFGPMGWRNRIWESPTLPYKTHVLEIRVLGTKDAASRGTTIVVDALDVRP